MSGVKKVPGRGARIDSDAFGSTISDQAVIIGRTLRAYGRDPERFFAEFGLRVPREPSPYVRFPANLMADIWNRAAEVCADPHFALRAAEQITPCSYHLLGPLLHASRSARQALRLYCDYAGVISVAYAPTLSERGETLLLTFHERRDRPSSVAHDVSLCYVLRLLKRINDPRVRPVRITLLRSESELSPLLLEMLPCPVEFRAEARSILFECDPDDETTEVRPAARCEQFLTGYLRMLKAQDKQWAQFRALLMLALENGRADVDELVNTLRVSRRTLQRRLAAQRTSFTEELESIRCELLPRHLCNEHASMTQVAHELGFYDSSHFSKAVKRWIGLTPREFHRMLTGKRRRPSLLRRQSSAEAVPSIG